MFLANSLLVPAWFLFSHFFCRPFLLNSPSNEIDLQQASFSTCYNHTPKGQRSTATTLPDTMHLTVASYSRNGSHIYTTFLPHLAQKKCRNYNAKSISRRSVMVVSLLSPENIHLLYYLVADFRYTHGPRLKLTGNIKRIPPSTSASPPSRVGRGEGRRDGGSCRSSPIPKYEERRFEGIAHFTAPNLLMFSHSANVENTLKMFAVDRLLM